MAKKRIADPFMGRDVTTEIDKFTQQAPAGWSDLPVGLALRRMRMRRGLKQRELADLACLPQSHISDLERGKVDVRVGTLSRLYERLGFRLLLLPRAHKPLRFHWEEN